MKVKSVAPVQNEYYDGYRKFMKKFKKKLPASLPDFIETASADQMHTFAKYLMVEIKNSKRRKA